MNTKSKIIDLSIVKRLGVVNQCKKREEFIVANGSVIQNNQLTQTETNQNSGQKQHLFILSDGLKERDRKKGKETERESSAAFSFRLDKQSHPNIGIVDGVRYSLSVPDCLTLYKILLNDMQQSITLKDGEAQQKPDKLSLEGVKKDIFKVMEKISCIPLPLPLISLLQGVCEQYCILGGGASRSVQ